MALQGHGISCQLDGEGQAGLSDILEIGILVPARDADRAQKIIEQNEAKHHNAAPRRHAEIHHPEQPCDPESSRGHDGDFPGVAQSFAQVFREEEHRKDDKQNDMEAANETRQAYGAQ